MSENERKGNLASNEMFNSTVVEESIQCRKCLLRSDGTPWSNDYRKSQCAQYKYPEHKPIGVLRGTEICTFFVEDHEVQDANAED